MFTLKNRKPKATVISESSIVKGDLMGSSGLQINGFIEGDVKDLTVTINKKGKVKGNIRAEFVEIKGKVKGSVVARILKCGDSSTIVGDLTYRELIVEDGAIIKGSCKKVVPKKSIKNSFKIPDPA